MSDNAFKDAVTKIESTIKDLSSLEVLTFRGNITAHIDKDKGTISWDTLLEAAKTNGELKLALATQVSLDSDVSTFIADEEPPDWIVKAHQESVKAGLESRRAIVDLVMSFVPKKT